MNPDETRRQNIKRGIAYGFQGYAASIDSDPFLLVGYEIGCHDRQIDRMNSRIDDLLERVTKLEKYHSGPTQPTDSRALRPEDV
jgi:hypothetical protein